MSHVVRPMIGTLLLTFIVSLLCASSTILTIPDSPKCVSKATSSYHSQIASSPGHAPSRLQTNTP